MLAKQRYRRTPIRLVALAALAPVVGACSSDPGASTINIVPSASQLMRPDWTSFSGGKEEFTLRPPTREDLVGPQGECSVAAANPAVDANSDPAGTSLTQGIALQMTECEVVRRAGAPDNVELGANERGERSVVLTYVRGARPGVYRFAGGRLYSIERGPEPATPARQQKAAPAKKRA
ncbi:MAG: hypothetical protein QOC56_1942 [Alphaproteobacteria bacterium]|nr:hypothetical protein [Alphaproteobacteria bacterium]